MNKPSTFEQHAADLDWLASRRPSRTLLALMAGSVVVAGYIAYTTIPAAPAAPMMPPVVVAVPLQRDVMLWDDFVGRFEATKSVEVRPRISGQVTAVHFTDGQVVKAGQPLYTIDPRPFLAALAEARAGVATAESDLVLARTDLDRALRLIEADAVSRSEIDRLKARVQAATAAMAAAQSRVRSRSLDVEFSTVRAPIAGRISDGRVDAGNLVTAGDAPAGTLLTTINALDPIYFSFDGSEALYLKSKRQGDPKGMPVEVRLQDEAEYRWKGQLDFTDNGLDMRSGTIRARAILPNRDLFLSPGMFGNMRLSSGRTVKAMLVPDAALQTDQARKVLLTVGKDGTVVPKPVESGPVVDGLRVILAGLDAGDRIIIAGIQMAAPGAKVAVKEGKITPVRQAFAATMSVPASAQATLAQ